MAQSNKAPPGVPGSHDLEMAATLEGAATEQTLPAAWDVNAYANALLSLVVGRWHHFAKSGFKRAPLEQWTAQWPIFAG